jgi:hypothetical protein
MYNLQGRAYQTKSGIYVRLSGLLANSCMRAEITGTYPGSIIHIVDPGYAEIVIHEFKRPGSQMCLEHLVPWHEHIMLNDVGQSRVAIYINGSRVLIIDVEGALVRVDDTKDWIVTALTGSPKVGPFIDCAVHHKDDIVLAIYSRVFGPDTRAACDAFRAGHCSPLQL